MGLFGNKKKGNESLHTLSEKEIQARLYGTFRNPQATASDVPMTAPPAAKSSPNGGYAQEFSRPAVKNSKPETMMNRSSLPAVDPESEKDLFKMSQSVQSSGLSNKVQPGDTVPSFSKETSQFTPAPKPAPKAPSFPVGAWVSAAARLFRGFVLKTLAALGWALRSLFRLVLAIDFRKPLVRRFAYGVGIFALLAFLFGSIQSLNGKREAAMKNPPKPAVRKIHASAPKQAKAAASKKQEQKKTVEAQKTPASETPQNTADSKASAAKTSKKESKPATDGKAVETKDSNPAAVPAAVGPAPSSQGNYSIQIATFAAREDAEKLTSALTAQQFETFIKPLNRPGGRVYYCVFVGHYPSSAEGEKKLEDFKKKDVAKPFQDAFVRSVQGA